MGEDAVFGLVHHGVPSAWHRQVLSNCFSHIFINIIMAVSETRSQA